MRLLIAVWFAGTETFHAGQPRSKCRLHHVGAAKSLRAEIYQNVPARDPLGTDIAPLRLL